MGSPPPPSQFEHLFAILITQFIPHFARRMGISPTLKASLMSVYNWFWSGPSALFSSALGDLFGKYSIYKHHKIYIYRAYGLPDSRKPKQDHVFTKAPTHVLIYFVRYVCTWKRVFREHLNIPEKVSPYDRCPFVTGVPSSQVSLHDRCPYITGVPSSQVSLHHRCPFITGVPSSQVSQHHRCPFITGALPWRWYDTVLWRFPLIPECPLKTSFTV